MALPILQDQPNYDSWVNNAGALLENTADDAAAAAYEQGAEGGLTNDYFRRSARNELEARGGKVLSPEELNQKYGAEGILFKEPMSELVAEDVARHRREQNILNQRIGMGPDGLTNWLRQKGNQAVGGFLYDPLTFGLYAAGGALVGPAARAVGLGAAVAAPGIAGVAARSAGTAAIGALAQTPLEMYQSHLDQNDIHATDVIESYIANVASNVVFDVGVHGLAKGASAIGKRGWNWFAKSNDMGGRDAINLAINQAWGNKRPDPTVISALIERERFSQGPVDVTDFSGRIERNSQINENGMANGRFFYGTNSTLENFGDVAPGGIKPFEKNYGDGYYFTDDVIRANNFAASKFNENQGNIFEIGLKDALVIHADNPFPADSVQSVKRIITEAAQDSATKKQVSEALDGNASIKDIFDTVHELSGDNAPVIIDAINNELRKRGYDGYVLDSNGRNELMLFASSKGKVESRGTYKPDQKLNADSAEVSPLMQERYNAQMESPESDLFHDRNVEMSVDELNARVKEFGEDPLADPILEAERMAAMEELEFVKERLNKDDLATLDELSGKAKESKISEQIKTTEIAIKSAMICVDR